MRPDLCFDKLEELIEKANMYDDLCKWNKLVTQHQLNNTKSKQYSRVNKKTNKYGGKKIVLDGHVFDSKTKTKYYYLLKMKG